MLMRGKDDDTDFDPAAWFPRLPESMDPFGICDAVWQVQKNWWGNPQALSERVTRLGEDLIGLQTQGIKRFWGLDANDRIQPVPQDERFLDPAWKDNLGFDLLKEYYLLYTRWIEDAIFATPGVPEKTRRRAAFWARQFLNTVSPTNFFWTNPVAMQRFMTSGGQSTARGLENILKDVDRKDISMVEPDAFSVGKNLAVTPGQVVMRNELVELIQYAPTTDKTYPVPILIAAPWINKYYILDLSPAKSLVSFLVAQGYTVFMTSWRNPTSEMRDTTLEDYMLKGILASIDAAREITGSEQVHAVGYCLGGTMLSALMAWLAKAPKKEGKPPIVDWTLFTALVEFSNPGDIDVFIDERSIAHLEEKMEKSGFLDGNEMGWTFRMLRANSLIWRYIVHNYMYGEEPPAFDVLYWNTDSTRLPAAMHTCYLREMYLENKLARPEALEFGGRKLDLGRITAPLYAIGTEQDHIAPWKETFKVCGLVGGPVRYALATSGHILGIVNPPSDKPKGHHWVGEATGEQDAEAWRMKLERKTGTWWNDWVQWLTERSGKLAAPPSMGNEKYPPLVAAPGTYVLER